jgi:hypothetical protein
VLKAYLIVTATIFSVFAAFHIWATLVVWPQLTTDPWFVLGRAGIAVAGGLLSIWGWRLLQSVLRAR